MQNILSNSIKCTDILYHRIDKFLFFNKVCHFKRNKTDDDLKSKVVQVTRLRFRVNSI